MATETAVNTSLEANKQISLRFFDQAFNKFNKSVLDELLSPHYVRYDPAMPNGRGDAYDLRNFIDMISCGLPDVNHVPKDVMAVDDKVITRFEATARHSGELMGIPATGKAVCVTGINIDRIENGRIVETNVMWDLHALIQQITE